MDVFFRVAHDFGLLAVGCTWLAASMAVYLDARQRFEDPTRAHRFLAASLALPLVVPFVYLCVRPQETLLDRRERSATRRWLEALHDVGERCLVCRTPIEPSYLRCPGCTVELRRPCSACGSPIKLHWNACPQCAAPSGTAVMPYPERSGRAA